MISTLPPFQLLGSLHVHVSKNLQSKERLSIHVYIENVVFWTRKICVIGERMLSEHFMSFRYKK